MTVGSRSPGRLRRRQDEAWLELLVCVHMPRESPPPSLLFSLSRVEIGSWLSQEADVRTSVSGYFFATVARDPLVRGVVIRHRS